ncbi:MAG: L-lactate permease [Rhizobiales bacterium]|nr:L-lactate permease [Hyphomicrobiales bacterium]
MTEFSQWTSVTQWILAALPILTVLILMTRFQWGGARAGAAGWFIAMIVAALFFGAELEILIHSQTKGILLTLYVLYIVWAALLLYFITDQIGAIAKIGQAIQTLTASRELQLLIIGWVFASFLQGVAGFGVPIAVVAPLLLAMRFSPLVAVAAPAIGHSWSVTFGNMATSYEALLAVTGMQSAALAQWSAFLLGISCLLCGWAVLMVYGGWKSVRRALWPLVIIGSVMAITQYILVSLSIWTIGGFTAGIFGLLVSIPVAKYFCKNTQDETTEAELEPEIKTDISLFWAMSAYLIFIAVIIAASFIAPIKELLNHVKLTLEFPALSTNHGWQTPAGDGKSISIFGHAGAHLLYTALLAFLLYWYKGFYKLSAAKNILKKTAKSAIPTSLGMVSMVCFAVVMDHSGMTYTLAQGISVASSVLYPVVAVAIGSLGAFMTGSTTNSNVVFGTFQIHAAQIGNFNIPLILAAQTVGASLGSMLAPAKILIGCSTVGLGGKEGEVLKTTLKWGIYLVGIIGIIVLFINFVIG